VRVTVGHAGGRGDPGLVDGALLVEPAGGAATTLLAENAPMVLGASGGMFQFRLEPAHTAAGTVTLKFTLFRPDGTPVDDSPDNNSMSTTVEFHTALSPLLVLSVEPDINPSLLSEIVGDLAEEILTNSPAADVDVQVLPLPVTPERAGSGYIWPSGTAIETDQPVIVGRVYNAGSSAGDEWFIADSFSFGVERGLFEFPGDYSQRFDPSDYCQAIDALGVPCKPADLGLTTDEPVSECETEPVDWAGLQLDLCVDPDPVSADRPVDSFAIDFESISFDHAQTGGWIMLSGDWDGDSSDGPYVLTNVQHPPSAITERLVGAIEGAVNGTAPADLAVQLVDADGLPLVAVPATALHRSFVKSWSTSGDTDDRPTGERPDPGGPAGYLGAIPLVDGAVAAEIVSLPEGVVIDLVPLDSAVPQVGTVHVETVGSNETITVGSNQGVTVSWELDLAGGEPPLDQSYDILWSNDGFATWVAVAVGINGNEVMLKNTSHYPPGENVQVRVVPGGVMHTDDWDQPASEPFTVPGGPPLVAIAGPDGPVEQWDPIEKRAIVGRPGDPTVGNSGDLDLVWSIDEAEAGAATFDGRLLTARDLPPGEYVVELVVTDPATGEEASAETVIEIVPRTSPTRYGETPHPEIVELLAEDRSSDVDRFVTCVDCVEGPDFDLVGDGVGGEDEVELSGAVAGVCSEWWKVGTQMLSAGSSADHGSACRRLGN
jgi:hypothetical protein